MFSSFYYECYVKVFDLNGIPPYSEKALNDERVFTKKFKIIAAQWLLNELTQNTIHVYPKAPVVLWNIYLKKNIADSGKLFAL